jgi:adenylate cyclase
LPVFKDKLLRRALEAYNGKHVLNRVLKHGEKALTLGGEVKDMTVYFQDIAGFTEISKDLSPEDLVHFINDYLTIMTKTIESHEGIIDRYMGDAIMAFFGANDEKDHADKACDCALAVVEQGRLLSKRWSHKGVPALKITVGINSGRVILGNFGTSFRFQYTIFGDHVNFASRLEKANLHYGTNVLMSEFTKEKLSDQARLKEVDLIFVKGQENPVKLFTFDNIYT